MREEKRRRTCSYLESGVVGMNRSKFKFALKYRPTRLANHWHMRIITCLPDLPLISISSTDVRTDTTLSVRSDNVSSQL